MTIVMTMTLLSTLATNFKHTHTHIHTSGKWMDNLSQKKPSHPLSTQVSYVMTLTILIGSDSGWWTFYNPYVIVV